MASACDPVSELSTTANLVLVVYREGKRIAFSDTLHT